jgi:hypothetical protein
MKVARQIGAALISLIAFCVAAGQEQQSATLPVGSATVAEFKGEVSLHSPQGEALTAAPSLILAPESVIETHKGSSILLNLADNSQILIKANSHVVLKSPAEGRGDYLELLIGRLLAKIQKRLGNAPAFRMGTPTAVITVRGTRFMVEVNKRHKTSIEVYEGVVEVAGFVQGMRPVVLQPGFHTGVDQDRGPEQPREILGGDDRSPYSGRNDDRSGPGFNSGRSSGGDDQRSGGQSGQSEQSERDHD